MISIRLNLSSIPKIDRIIEQLPRTFSAALNDSLYDTRDKLVRETWPKALERSARGRKLTVKRQLEAGRAVMRVKTSHEFNLSGSVYANMPQQNVAPARPLPVTAHELIHAFVHSTSPVFQGKSKQDRIRMALAVYYREMRRREFRQTVGKFQTELLQREFVRFMIECAQRNFPRRIKQAIASV